jgi:hypothetical protein
VIIDQPLFPVPRSKAAKEIAKLHDRRRELQHQERQALIARDSARAQHERLDEQVRSAEALALAHDKPASTKRDVARLGQLAHEVSDRDHRSTALGAAIVAIEGEIRKCAQANHDELMAKVMTDYDQARYQIDAALASLEAARARARGAYVAAQSLAANAGDMHVTRGLRDVPPTIEDIVRDGGLASLLPDHDHAIAT